MNTNQVRVLLISDPEEIPTVARNIGLAPGYAAQLRTEWLRKINNQCVHCGKEFGATHKCHGTMLDHTKVWDLLNEVLDKPLLKRACRECGRKFELTGQMVRYAIKGRYLQNIDRCASCLLEEKERRERLMHQPFAILREIYDGDTDKAAKVCHGKHLRRIRGAGKGG